MKSHGRHKGISYYNDLKFCPYSPRCPSGGVSQIMKSFVWIDPLFDKDFNDMPKNADNIIWPEL